MTTKIHQTYPIATTEKSKVGMPVRGSVTLDITVPYPADSRFYEALSELTAAVEEFVSTVEPEPVPAYTETPAPSPDSLPWPTVVDELS